MQLLMAFILAAAVLAAALAIRGELREARLQRRRDLPLEFLKLFAPGLAAASADPRALLAWQPLAVAARKLAPEAFAELDLACGAAFPFSPEQLQAAHAKWTADWLVWERAHDMEYKLKAAAAEADVAASGGAALARTRADAVEREKLELYQRRYVEYVQTAKALQALLG